MKKNYLILLAIVISLNSYGQYALPIYDPFDANAYTLGRLAGQMGWTGNILAPGNGAQVTDYPLTYPGLYSQPSTYSVLFGNQTGGATQALPLVNQTSTVYVSFLMQVSSLPLTLANSRYNFGYGSTTTGGSFAGCMYVVPVTAAGGGTNFNLGFNGTNSQPTAGNTTTDNFGLNTTIMVVMAYTPGAAGAGTVSAWVNPNAATFGGIAPSPTFADIPGGTITNVASVFIRSQANTNPMTIDELRVGLSWNDVTTFSTPLPVSIDDLSISSKDNISTIAWKSLTESRFDRYEVLYSKNGMDFNSVGTVKGKGSNAQYSFSFLHEGEAFFKLKMIDADGRFVYSEVLHTWQKLLKVKIGPNPFSNRLSIAGLPVGQNTIVFYNEVGAKIKTVVVKDNTASIAVSTLANGTYILQIINNGKTVYNSMLIKK